MRWPSLVASTWLLGGCITNTITLESEADATTSDPSDGSMEGAPPSATTGRPSSTTGPADDATTDAPSIPDVWSVPPDLGALDTGSIECIPPCNPGEVCIDGLCFGEPPDCGFEQPWSPCLEPGGNPNDMLCAPLEVCLSDGTPATVGICATVGCQDACDCPFAPDGVDPPVVGCDDLTGSGEQACFLDCSGGQICPDGTVCFGGFICIYPAP